MSDLKGKAVIVTGASSGIGEACAIHFASKGCSVTLNGRDGERLQAAVEKCKAAATKSGHTQARFIAVRGDISEPGVQAAAVEQTAQEFGKIDVLVANHATVGPADSFDQVTEESFDTTVNVNLKSMLFLIKRALPHLEHTKGCVVCVSSLGSVVPTNGGLFVYSITKAAMNFMVRSLAMELGPKGIRVNCTLPTFVRTRIFRNHADNQEDAWDQLFTAATPLTGPTSGPEEQAEVIAFLASDAARYVSGQSLLVDGAVFSRGNPLNFAHWLKK